MRARPNQRHVAPQHIQELGQFVDACRSQQPSDGRHSRIITRRLYNGWPILLDRHCSKFEYDKFLAVKSLSALPKNYRSRTIKFDRDGGKNHERQEKYQRQGTHENIHGALYETLGATKGRSLNFDGQDALTR